MSKMKDNFTDIYKVLTTDETLLRLLYYPSANTNATESPLYSGKANILSKTALEKWTIITDIIKMTPKTDDLDILPKCRLLFYPGKRGLTNNYLYAVQEVVFDILVHESFEEVDLRMEWICDRVNELVFDQKITGIAKIKFINGSPISSPPNFLGYRLIYSFGSGQD